ncbi:MAG: alpha/beta hydrolase [Candidatus Thorarchaeota archaeon]
MQNIIFIHGLESSGKGFKGKLLKKTFPEILTPDFKAFNPEIPMDELLDIRMKELNLILATKKSWIIIGSSYGGLMATLYTLQNPDKVDRLILLAPFLTSQKLQQFFNRVVEIPVIVYHGRNDKVISHLSSRERAKRLFNNLEYNLVEDDHSLHKTVQIINWGEIIPSS